MIIIKIVGGLGNQMFCYAYAKALEQMGHNIKIDISAFTTYKLHGGYQLDEYDIDLKYSTEEENSKFYSKNFVTKIIRRLGFNHSKIIQESSLCFDKNLLNIHDYCYINGYFQSEKYFQNIRHILLKQFKLKKDKSPYTKEIENKIFTLGNSCSIHIRRGDFINNQNINIHGACSLEYYKNAMMYLEEKVGNLNYFIFSDDIEWTKKNLTAHYATYVENIEKRFPHEDMYLMSLCNHNIIANSSFSWWGAWLNQNNEKIVIAPKRWFADNNLERQSKDIVCAKWIRI